MPLVLPGPQQLEELERLAREVRPACVPLRAIMPASPHLTHLVAPDRRGWAVRVRLAAGAEPSMLAPLALLFGAYRLEVDSPDRDQCQVIVQRQDPGLGLALLELRPLGETEEGCPLVGTGAALPLFPTPPLDALLRPDPAPARLFALPLAGDPVERMLPVALLGPGEGPEGFYLVHDAAWAYATPLVDQEGRLYAIAAGPSWLRPAAGLGIGSRSVEELLAGRRIDGKQPYTPVGRTPDWPPQRGLAPTP